jgi:hypothetical protein
MLNVHKTKAPGRNHQSTMHPPVELLRGLWVRLHRGDVVVLRGTVVLALPAVRDPPGA